MDDLPGVLEYTVPGTYSFKLKRRTKAKISIVGPGQYRTRDWSRYNGWHYYSGSSGAAFVGGVILPAGAYSVHVGNSYEGPREDDTFGYTYWGKSEATVLSNSLSYLISTGEAPGDIYKSSNLELIPGTIELETGGYFSFNENGQGGASRYNGWGHGANYDGSGYTTGYFKIEW